MVGIEIIIRLAAVPKLKLIESLLHLYNNTPNIFVVHIRCESFLLTRSMVLHNYRLLQTNSKHTAV